MRSSWSARPAFAAAALLALFCAECALAARADAPTFDETTHLAQGLLHVLRSDYRFQADHPPFAKLVAAGAAAWAGARLPPSSPAWRGDFSNPLQHRAWAQRVLYETPGNRPERLIRAGRLALIPLAMVTLLVVWRWTRALAGETAGLVALVLAAVDPNLIAHGHLVTSDAAVTAMMAAAAYALWRALARWDARWAVAGGVTLGLALATKYTAIVLAAGVPVLALARAMDPGGWPTTHRATVLGTRARRVVAAAALVGAVAVSAWVCLWAAYRFRAAVGPELPVGLTGAALQAWFGSSSPRWLGVVRDLVAHRWIPDAWGLGIVHLAADARLVPRVSYLAGRLSPDGWWYYFPVTLALKMPLPTIGLAVVGSVALLRGSRATRAEAGDPLGPAARRWAAIVIIGVPLAVLGVAMTSRLDLGLRQVLPVYPFLLIQAGAGAGVGLRLGRIGRTAVAAALAWAVISSTAVAPDYIAYFNEAAGGPGHGLDWLADSNLDWGQALRQLPRWLRARGIHEVNLCYFGTADPDAYPLRYVSLPGCEAFFAKRPPGAPRLPGYVAISATHIAGVHQAPELRAWYRELLARGRRVGVVRHAIHVYEVPAEP